MKIAVDAMGGDHAPDAIVLGALYAIQEFGSEIILVGDQAVLKKTLDLHGGDETGLLRVHHCAEMVFMDDSPLKAVRHKKDASIRVAFDLLKRGEADAVVSAGNSGATMAAAILTLGRIKGVDRPAFTSILPGDRGGVILLDVGANVDCRPEHLFQFGIMAHGFATTCLGMHDPKVGLLSIGEEGNKGNDQVRLAHDYFRESRLNFAGNVEGRDLFSGRVQIIVCDGFVGNVVLKVCEGMAEAITRMLKQEMLGTPLGKASLFLGRKGFQRLKDSLDYAEYGGAPLLGVNGVGIVCHGGSSPKAIKNAVKMAGHYAENRIQEKLSQNIEQFQKIWESSSRPNSNVN